MTGATADAAPPAVGVVASAAVAGDIGTERTGPRISPRNPCDDVVEHDTRDPCAALLAGVAPLNLACLHVVHGGDEEVLRQLRRERPTALFLNRAGAGIDARVADLDAGLADVVTVGTTAPADPGLPARRRSGTRLNGPDPATSYRGDHLGRTDCSTPPWRPPAVPTP
ncbi:hypothetical protein GCM10010129_58230 [Streptomyces fumigatiscleroticus]|nr:hypothetical protein GCM10010129_58230 [Streptomyces fumigatiscleroticus]